MRLPVSSSTADLLDDPLELEGICGGTRINSVRCVKFSLQTAREVQWRGTLGITIRAMPSEVQRSETLGITIRAIPSEVLLRNRVLYEELGWMRNEYPWFVYVTNVKQWKHKPEKRLASRAARERVSVKTDTSPTRNGVLPCRDMWARGRIL